MSDLHTYFKHQIVKFGLSGKHTKFEKNLSRGFEKSADLLSKCQNHEEDIFKYVCFSESPNFIPISRIIQFKKSADCFYMF